MPSLCKAGEKARTNMNPVHGSRQPHIHHILWVFSGQAQFGVFWTILDSIGDASEPVMAASRPPFW